MDFARAIDMAKEYLGAGWVGTVLGVVGLLFAFWQYVKGRQVTRLSWQAAGVRLVGPSATAFPGAIEVRYGGKVVPRLSLAKLYVWNSGTTTIRRADVVEADPLRAWLGADVLDVVVEASTRAANGFRVKADGGQAVMDFDFLDPGDGARIAVLHTGESLAAQPQGTVRGAPLGWDRQGEPAPPRSAAPLWEAASSIGLATAVTLFLSLGQSLRWTWVLYMVVAASAGTGAAVLKRYVSKRYPPRAIEERPRLPDDGIGKRTCTKCPHNLRSHVAPAAACSVAGCGCGGFLGMDGQGAPEGWAPARPPPSPAPPQPAGEASGPPQ